MREVLDPLKAAFVGKDEVVDLLGVSLVAGENLFVLGPPGTAKSALVHELGRRLDGRTFEYLLTRFTEPSELFGPFDIRRLREGELVTNTDGMLPEASLVFLDELLNANSAILNSLLTVLNERTLRRGRETLRVPVLMVVGASNRLPDDDALQALFDRFLLRVTSDNVPGERLGDVLERGWRLDMGQVERGTRMSIDDVRALHAHLSRVDLGAVRRPYAELVTRLRAAGVALSDRRAVKLQRLIAASALLCGRTAAAPSDLWVVRYAWDTDDQREVLAGLVGEVLAGAAEDPLAHPRARHDGAPDPEALARDLDALAAGAPAGASPAVLAQARDRLGALAARSAWVRDASLRGQLEGRIEALWARLGEKP